MRLKALAIFLLGGLFITEIMAQEGGVRATGIGGRNSSFGYFAGTEVAVHHIAQSWFQVSGALRYTSFPEYTLDIRPGIYYNLKSGKIHADILIQGAYQSNIYDLCTGISAGYRHKWFWVSLGYYYRLIQPSDGSRGVSEPRNLMYEAGVSLLPDIQKWDLNMIISNSRLAELERFHQPSLIVEGMYYPLCNLGIHISAALRRAGLFNLSSNCYQEYLSVGISYRW